MVALSAPKDDIHDGRHWRGLLGTGHPTRWERKAKRVDPVSCDCNRRRLGPALGASRTSAATEHLKLAAKCLLVQKKAQRMASDVSAQDGRAAFAAY